MAAAVRRCGVGQEQALAMGACSSSSDGQRRESSPLRRLPPSPTTLAGASRSVACVIVRIRYLRERACYVAAHGPPLRPAFNAHRRHAKPSAAPTADVQTLRAQSQPRPELAAAPAAAAAPPPAPGRSCPLRVTTMLREEALSRCSHSHTPCQVPSMSLPRPTGTLREQPTRVDLMCAGQSSVPSASWRYSPSPLWSSGASLSRASLTSGLTSLSQDSLMVMDALVCCRNRLAMPTSKSFSSGTALRMSSVIFGQEVSARGQAGCASVTGGGGRACAARSQFRMGRDVFGWRVCSPRGSHASWQECGPLAEPMPSLGGAQRPCARARRGSTQATLRQSR